VNIGKDIDGPLAAFERNLTEIEAFGAPSYTSTRKCQNQLISVIDLTKVVHDGPRIKLQVQVIKPIATFSGAVTGILWIHHRRTYILYIPLGRSDSFQSNSCRLNVSYIQFSITKDALCFKE